MNSVSNPAADIEAGDAPSLDDVVRAIVVETVGPRPRHLAKPLGVVLKIVGLTDYMNWREAFPNARDDIYPGPGKWSTRGRPELSEEAEALAAEAEDMGPPDSWPAWTDGHTYELGPAPADRD